MSKFSLHRTLLVTLTVLLSASAKGLLPVRADEVKGSYPPSISLPQLRRRISTGAAPHPRLLASGEDLAAIRQSVQGDRLRRSIAEVVIRQATMLRDEPPVARIMKGKRLLAQSRLCVKRVITLALAFHLTGNRLHAGRCQQEMLAAARFRDWNPSHFLDVAEMTFALALGYDWLYDQLDDAARDEIRTAIVQKGVRLPLEHDMGWIRSQNNWGQVCHAGMVAGALAVMEDEPELAARTIDQALRNVTRSMAAYAPHGSYPEGPDYWSYGTSYNGLLIAALESALGTDFGLSQAPGFRETGQFLSLACGPSGLFFNYSDGGAQRSPQPVLFWFAARYQRPDWLLGEYERLQQQVESLQTAKSASAGGRFLPLALLWMRSKPERVINRMPLNWSSGGATPITVHRSAWNDPDATYLGLKAGTPSANHGHMDIGSFVLDADGQRWALDLGAEGYYRIESLQMNLWNRSQDSDRWTIFRLNNKGHNTLVIDGQLQRVSGYGKVVSFSAEPSFSHTIVDMSSVYRGQAKSVRRGVALLPSREVLIQDELSGLKPGSQVRWAMITRGVVERLGQSTIQLRRADAHLTLSILGPDRATWKEIDTATPKNSWDSPNPGTRMLAFEAVAPPSGQLLLSVLATPGSCQESSKDAWGRKPLREWGP